MSYCIHRVTLRTNGFAQSQPAWSCHRGLIRLSKYRMCQWATAVHQPPFSSVFNTADNALDGFDVSGVQATTCRIRWNRQHPLSVGMNLSNNRKTNILGLLCFQFRAFGNGNDNDVQKLPEKNLRLKLFGKVSMALVSIDKLLILSRKR